MLSLAPVCLAAALRYFLLPCSALCCERFFGFLCVALVCHVSFWCALLCLALTYALPSVRVRFSPIVVWPLRLSIKGFFGGTEQNPVPDRGHAMKQHMAIHFTEVT